MPSPVLVPLAPGPALSLRQHLRPLEGLLVRAQTLEHVALDGFIVVRD